MTDELAENALRDATKLIVALRKQLQAAELMVEADRGVKRRLNEEKEALREQLRAQGAYMRNVIPPLETDVRRLTAALREIVLLQGNMMQTAGIIARRALAEMRESG